MKEPFLKKIARETQNAKKGKPARIIAKMNALDEKDITLALYEASKAGVKVDLIVRGYCCLRPGVKDLSENIRVISVIGRFLEHSRVFYFQNGEDDPLKGELFIGSADWMYRNLQTRVEAVVPIDEPSHKEKIYDILNIMLEDHRQGWILNSDGTYERKKVKQPKKELGTHALLMQKARNRGSN
jgi:polyphosphate kinase